MVSSLRRIGEMFCIVALLVSVLAGSEALAQIEWRSGDVVAVQPMPRARLEAKLRELAGRQDRQRVVLQLAGPIDADGRATLEADGVRLLNPLGSHAWFATLEKGLDASRAAAFPGLVRIDVIATVNKLHPDLAAGISRPWAIFHGEKPSEFEDKGDESPETLRPANPFVAIYAIFHSDFDLEREARELVADHGGRIRSYLRSINGAVIHLPANRINELAEDDAVMWLEPPLPQFVELNDDNRPRVGADTLQGPPYGLDGSGVTVMVYDGGRMFTHGDFDGRLTIGASDTAGISDHSTHVGGTIGGDGAGSGGQYRGMAPAVDIISYGFEQEGGLSEWFLYTDPGDLEADYGEAISVYGADLSNNSIGTNTAPNGFPCEWEGNYGATGVLIDAIARGSFGSPFRIVWANGNERQGSARCGATYLTTAPPACAKNHITVGALNSDTESVTSFTSWGPCDDGRLKPDISAPGCQEGGDGGVTSTSSSGGYNSKCGTSMASPTTAGVAALILEQYRASFPFQPDIRNSTMKAILATTAVDLVETGPDYQTGYGSIRAVPAVDLVTDGRFVEAEVGQGDVYSFLLLVDPFDLELKVTLAWDDPSGTPNVDPVLVNDLDLRVIDSGGTIHYPWTLDPQNPSDPAVRNQRDGVNNIEQVVIDNPAPGAYRVEIEGFSIAQGFVQSFSAAATETLINCSPAGILAVNATRVACSATLGIQLIDCDLNTDDGIVETVAVSVTSQTEPGGESVTLIESAPEAAAFLGSIGVDTVDAPGVIHVTEGDTITVTYIDADDGEGNQNVPVTREVVVDCSPPIIIGVSVPEINPRDATVMIEADEAMRTTISYGTSCGDLTGTAGASTFDVVHSIRIAGLIDDTTYYFAVQAEDLAGNQVTDDNSGACYSFTTLEVPDFMTEEFAGDLDLQQKTITFTPNGSGDFYSRCVSDLAGGLPTDPTGGTDSGLGDDQPTSFTLSGGAMVQLYGQSYDTVFVGPNGYLTFGEGDSDYTETLGDHFDTPRVVGYWDDLNPGAGGSVSWLQLLDRVAVTWQDVPEYNTSNTQTFQIEMYFDGRIRLSWVQVDSQDGIVGLSEGNGLDPDFFESDLSVDSGCGPRPPFTQPMAVETGVSVPLSIGLQASDDGLPAPPALSYLITELPSFGTLEDEAAGTLVARVPYRLAGAGNLVTYTPVDGFQGTDVFEYRADDGGAPPEGGLSVTTPVEVSVGGVQVVHEFLVDDTDPGWGAAGDWAFGQPSGGGSHDGDPTAGFTGNNVYGYNLDGDYANDLSARFLTTGAIDLTGVTGTVLEYRRWLGVDGATSDGASVLVRTGFSFNTAWLHSGAAVSESEWSLQSHDISAWADDEPQVHLSWLMGATDGSVTYPGWNLDDIRILGVLPPSVCSDAPAEVPFVGFADVETLQWVPPVDSGGVAPTYDTLRSSSASDFDGAAICVEADDGSDAIAVDATNPLSGGLFYYLIRAETPCGDGSLGELTGGTPRSGRACP